MVCYSCHDKYLVIKPYPAGTIYFVYVPPVEMCLQLIFLSALVLLTTLNLLSINEAVSAHHFPGSNQTSVFTQLQAFNIPALADT